MNAQIELKCQAIEIQPGDRVLVQWHRHGWLPGIFVAYTSAEYTEDFRRCVVKMDNGWACDGSGYHPACVRKVPIGYE